MRHCNAIQTSRKPDPPKFTVDFDSLASSTNKLLSASGVTFDAPIESAPIQTMCDHSAHVLSKLNVHDVLQKQGAQFE